jgi:hypothetical protein
MTPLLATSALVLALMRAQAPAPAVICGTVADPDHAHRQGVTVSLTEFPTALDVTTLTTDADGYYAFKGLMAGRYTIKIALDGFKTTLAPNIVLTPAHQVIRDFTLEASALPSDPVELPPGSAPVVFTQNFSKDIQTHDVWRTVPTSMAQPQTCK